MKFADFICIEAIRVGLKAKGGETVVREIAQALLDAGQLGNDQFESIVEAILKREQLGSTGMGRGVAIPHAKHPSVQQTVGTVAVSHGGVEFASLDGEPAHVFFLLVSPSDQSGNHFQALEKITRLVRNDTFCRFLQRVESAEDIEQLLDDVDNDQI
jgi:mannitol/fructose-specific phosphotransferase system IIA component (Ntr-type)